MIMVSLISHIQCFDFNMNNELSQLQSFISTEQLNNCQLVEVAVDSSVAPDLEALRTSQESCSVKTPLIVRNANDGVLRRLLM